MALGIDPRTGSRTPPPRTRRLLAGGAEGNEQLTALTGVVLIGLLAVLGITIVRIGQMLGLHMFLGVLLIGPVAVKMGSTGYRFARYYTGNAVYRRKGPPALEMRLLAPLVVLSTTAVFATGVALLFVGRAQAGLLQPLHKVSFIAWIAVTAIHVLGHLGELPSALRADRRAAQPWDDHGSGRGARVMLLAGALVLGLLLAIAVESQIWSWTGTHQLIR